MSCLTAKSEADRAADAAVVAWNEARARVEAAKKWKRPNPAKLARLRAEVFSARALLTVGDTDRDAAWGRGSRVEGPRGKKAAPVEGELVLGAIDYRTIGTT
jgi:hypothetical protein